MPRVVHLVPSFGWGGAERIGCTVHRMARQAGWDSRMDGISLSPVRAGILEDTGDDIPDRTDRESTIAGWCRAARARVKQEKPDIVHAHLAYPDRITASIVAAAGRPYVATFGLVPQRASQWSPDELVRVRSDRTLAWIAHTRSHTRFVAVSAADARILSPLIPARRLATVANFPPLEPARPPPVAPVDWPANTTRILTVGRLHEQKGYDRLIEALAAPSLRALRWHWIAVGDGDAREDLEAALVACRLRDRVTFTGTRPAYDLFPRSQIVLSPSRYEGWPLVPMEALQHRVPVVGSDIPQHHELMGRAHGSILPTDEAAWPAHLAPLLANADAREALRTRQESVRPVDPVGSMWAAYEAIYRAVASE